MKLKEYKNDYYELSGKASDINRQIAFAGIAIIWIFRITKNDAFILPQGLQLPIVFFVLGLSFDLIQYVWSSTTWGIFHRIKEKKHNEEDDINHPFILVIPIQFLYYAKIFSVIAAYFFLFKYIAFNCF